MPSFWDIISSGEADLQKMKDAQQQKRDQKESVRGRAVESGHGSALMQGLGAQIPAEPDLPAPANKSFDTPLTPNEEAAFQVWKQRNAPNDSGADYDLRGAFKGGASPASNGHWPDTWKKPNHPTFSDESIYAKDAPDKAGHWEGPQHDQYVPGSAALPHNAQPRQYQPMSQPFGALGPPASPALTQTQPFQPSDAIPDEPWQSKVIRHLWNTPGGMQRLLEATKAYPSRMWDGAIHAVTGPGRAWSGQMVPGSKDELETALLLAGPLGGMEPEVAMGPHAARAAGRMAKLDKADMANDFAGSREEESPSKPPPYAQFAEGYGQDWL